MNSFIESGSIFFTLDKLLGKAKNKNKSRPTRGYTYDLTLDLFTAQF